MDPILITIIAEIVFNSRFGYLLHIASDFKNCLEMLGMLGLKLPMFVMAFPSEWISFIWTDVGKWVGSVVPKGRPISIIFAMNIFWSIYDALGTIWINYGIAMFKIALLHDIGTFLFWKPLSKQCSVLSHVQEFQENFYQWLHGNS